MNEQHRALGQAVSEAHKNWASPSHNRYYADLGAVMEGRIAELGYVRRDETSEVPESEWRDRALAAETRLTEVRQVNDAAGAHRFDFTNPGHSTADGVPAGGPDDFYNGCSWVVRRVRRALNAAS